MVVVEIADGVRTGGQTVDLRGAGYDVITRMGLLPEVTSRALIQRGAAWVRSDGSRRAEMPVTAFDGNGLVSKLEILRGDLVDALIQATADRVEYRFGTRITELAVTDTEVVATLADGTAGGDTITADLVVGADGPHSAVRRLAFGPEDSYVHPLGGYNAWFSAPDSVGLDGWYLLYQAPGGLHASMRPTHDPSMAKAGLAFRSEPIDYDRHNLNEQRTLLIERFAGAGWECDRLLAAAASADDFYFDAFAQIHMPSWTTTRVALIGDAGYCASPLSGMGTSLALVGAYLLAGELGAAGEAPLDPHHLAQALSRYETRIRPYVDTCQDLPNSIDRYAPDSAIDITITAQVMKWMQRWPFRSIAAKKYFAVADSVELPDYQP